MRMQTGFNLMHGDDHTTLTDHERDIVAHMCVLLLGDAMERGPAVLGVDPSRVVMGPRLVAASIKHHVVHHAPHFLDHLPSVRRRVEQSMLESDRLSSCSDDDTASEDNDGTVDEDEHLASNSTTRATVERIESEWDTWEPTDPLLRALKRSVTGTCIDTGIH